jgi:hypothetical protein
MPTASRVHFGRTECVVFSRLTQTTVPSSSRTIATRALMGRLLQVSPRSQSFHSRLLAGFASR